MSEHSKPTQNQRVLDYIEETGGITSEMKPVKNRYGEVCHIKRYMMEE